MSEQQTTKNMTPTQTFEKAVIKAMLKNQRYFVTREEVRKHLPRDFDDNDPNFVDVNDYIFCPIKWDSNLDVIGLSRFPGLFTKADLEWLRFVINHEKPHRNISECNDLIVAYYQGMGYGNPNIFGRLLINRAWSYFHVNSFDDEPIFHCTEYDIYDGEEYVATILFNRVSETYDFYDDEDEDEGEGE